MKRMMSLRIQVIACSLFLSCSCSAGQSSRNADTSHLFKLIAEEKLASTELLSAAIDAGPSAIPDLAKFLETAPDEDQRSNAISAAIYIGGETAVPIVRREYERTRNEVFRNEIAEAALAEALTTVDNAENRKELIQFLKSDNWNTARAAALGLGLFRAKEAIPALQAVPRDHYPPVSQAADLALQWIEHGYYAIETLPNEENRQVVSAVLRNGSPNFSEPGPETYVTDLSGGFWNYSSTGWRFNVGLPPKQTGLSIGAFIGKERTRALVSVNLICGGLCGSGYNFVLRKEGEIWKVQLMVHTFDI
jgi:hypothetical protein